LSDSESGFFGFGDRVEHLAFGPGDVAGAGGGMAGRGVQRVTGTPDFHQIGPAALGGGIGGGAFPGGPARSEHAVVDGLEVAFPVRRGRAPVCRGGF